MDEHSRDPVVLNFVTTVCTVFAVFSVIAGVLLCVACVIRPLDEVSTFKLLGFLGLGLSAVSLLGLLCSWMKARDYRHQAGAPYVRRAGPGLILAGIGLLMPVSVLWYMVFSIQTQGVEDAFKPRYGVGPRPQHEILQDPAFAPEGGEIPAPEGESPKGEGEQTTEPSPGQTPETTSQ